ncbi:MAG: hypothetical protein ACE5F6_14435 [Anaerolineae bacterium]
MVEGTAQGQNSRKIQVLLADDHPVVRAGIWLVLEPIRKHG